MMGAEIRFMQLDEDLQSLQREMEARGFVLLAYYHPGPRTPTIIGTLSRTTFLEPSAWAALETELDQVSLYLPGDKGLVVDDANSPVINIAAGVGLDRPAPGRLYYMRQRVVEGRWRPWSADFAEASDSLFRWVRRNYVRRKDGVYIGPCAASRYADELRIGAPK